MSKLGIGEAGHLKSAKTVDVIRERITSARHEGIERLGANRDAEKSVFSFLSAPLPHTLLTAMSKIARLLTPWLLCSSVSRVRFPINMKHVVAHGRVSFRYDRGGYSYTFKTKSKTLAAKIGLQERQGVQFHLLY